MTAQTMLSHVRNDERGHTTKFFKLLNRFSEVFLFQEIQIKLIVGFKHALQSFSNTLSRFHRTSHAFHRLRKFVDGGNANLIPIKEIFLQPSKRLVGSFGRRIL